jgi:hypothetical protein
VDREDWWGGKVPDVSIHCGGVQACWRAAGGGNEKRNNSINCKQALISKAIKRMAESIETGASGSKSGMISMLSNQINQHTMHQQMFQQSMKMQIEGLEKKGDLTNTYLHCIARNIGIGGKRRNRSKHGCSSSSSSSSKDDDDSDDKNSEQDK